jgi:hypothetical protein
MISLIVFGLPDKKEKKRSAKRYPNLACEEDGYTEEKYRYMPFILLKT